MKNPQKYLQSAQRLEVRQVARKAPEIADAYAFDRQHAYYRRQQFDTMLEDEECLREAEQSAFEPFQDAETEWLQQRTDEMLSAQTFEDEVLESQQYAEDNAFDTIAAMLGFDFEATRPYAVKQLPAAPADLFVNDVTEVAERHLDEELTHNKQAITPWKEKVRTALIRQEEPASAQTKAAHQPPSDSAVDLQLSEEQIKAALQQEEELKKSPSANSVFFFRPPTPPKTP